MKCMCGGSWVHIGGTNAGCDWKYGCTCSVPIHVCNNCGDYDYGVTEEADRIRFQCKKEIALRVLRRD